LSSTGGDFGDISLERMNEYKAALRACTEVTSDYSFANIYGWSLRDELKWRFDRGMVWLWQAGAFDQYWAPVGDWAGYDWAGLKTDAPMRFIRVPETLLDIWKKAYGDRVRAAEARNDFDYVYSVPEMVELKGGKFHKKKNLLNQFEKSNAFAYEPLHNGMVDEVLDMQAEWLGWQECPSEALMAENDAITRVLRAFDDIECLMGGVIRVEGRIVAYTVGECLGNNTLLIHFEKGDTRYKGVYQAINQYFLKAQEGRFALVNREQDLGDEGLRKAKLSYNPIRLQRKYDVVITPAL
jgi:uncharacterized protein